MAAQAPIGGNPWYVFDQVQHFNSTLVNGAKKVGTCIKNTANAAGNRWNESSTVTKACIIGSTAAVAAPLAIIPALGAVGFTSAGVAAGSIAASMQTAATASGSLFALCQSAGATGTVALTTYLGVGAGAAVTAGGVTAAVCQSTSADPNNGDTEQSETTEENNGQQPHDEDRVPSEQPLE